MGPNNTFFQETHFFSHLFRTIFPFDVPAIRIGLSKHRRWSARVDKVRTALPFSHQLSISEVGGVACIGHATIWSSSKQHPSTPTRTSRTSETSNPCYEADKRWSCAMTSSYAAPGQGLCNVHTNSARSNDWSKQDLPRRRPCL